MTRLFESNEKNIYNLLPWLSLLQTLLIIDCTFAKLLDFDLMAVGLNSFKLNYFGIFVKFSISIRLILFDGLLGFGDEQLGLKLTVSNSACFDIITRKLYHWFMNTSFMILQNVKKLERKSSEVKTPFGEALVFNHLQNQL